MNKRVINVAVNPGEPMDGTGKVCIHLFIQDERGPFVEPHGLYIADTDKGKLLATRPTRGRLACNPRRTVAPANRGGVTTITPRTDDPRAVTCPKCIASAEYADIMEIIAAAEAVR